jgi:hypothetical protein
MGLLTCVCVSVCVCVGGGEEEGGRCVARETNRLRLYRNIITVVFENHIQIITAVLRSMCNS